MAKIKKNPNAHLRRYAILRWDVDGIKLNLHYELFEQPNGFVLYIDGEPVKYISHNNRNWLQAEKKFKQIVRKEARKIKASKNPSIHYRGLYLG